MPLGVFSCLKSTEFIALLLTNFYFRSLENKVHKKDQNSNLDCAPYYTSTSYAFTSL